MNKLNFVLTVMLFASCGAGKKESTKENEETNSSDTLVANPGSKSNAGAYTDFRSLIRQLKTVSLPVNFRLHQPMKTENLIEFRNVDPEDNILVKNQTNFVYGLLPDTSTYYAVITFIQADAFAPLLFTFTKTGKLISSEQLFVKGCGADCGIEKCTCDCLIDEKLNVTLVDTNHYYFCDDQGKEISGSRKYYYEKRMFQISNSGKVIGKTESKTDIKQ